MFIQSHCSRTRATIRRGQSARHNGRTVQRDGSTLLIVMVLLGLLSLIGFLFYTFAAGERSNATYYADGHKVYTSELDADTLFNWSLQQLIVGPNNNLVHSALAANSPTASNRTYSRKAMLPNLFGRDIHPYNSAGVQLGSNGGLPFTDMDRNGTADGLAALQDPLEFNDTGAAQGWVNDPTLGWISARDATTMPDSGVDYTYPDINNLFLAYKGTAIDANGNPVQVIIPSFHRPQLLRTAGGAPSATWWNDPLFSGRILRPHPNHLNPDGNTRFPSAPTGTLLTVFPGDNANPFRPGLTGQQGVWSLSTPYTYPNPVTYEWDVDNDGDLVKEGVWLDLHYPVQIDSAGRKFVPMFSFTVYDADALFNLNVHGNRNRQKLATVTSIGNIPALSKFVSSSNLGTTPSEVNPQFTFNSDPNVGPDFSGTLADLTTALRQYEYQFGGPPTNFGQLSNMEWYRILTGTANFQSPTMFSDVFSGRSGEAGTTLVAALNQGIAGGMGSADLTPVRLMPGPGITNLATAPNITAGSDDNWNSYEGGAWANLNRNTPGVLPVLPWEATSLTPGFNYASPLLNYNPGTPAFFPTAVSYFPSVPFGQPLDFNGYGTIVEPGTGGKTRLTLPLNRMSFPQYAGYDNPGATTSTVNNPDGTFPAGTSDPTNLFSIGAGWHPDSFLGQRMLDINGNPHFTAVNQGALPSSQIDEEAETIVEPSQVSPNDAIFPLDDTAWLHLQPTDRTNTGLSSRMEKLASFNLRDSTRASQIGERFTTLSFDRKQHGYAGTGLHRPWELTGGTLFPPTFGFAANSAANPFRAPVRKLLEMSLGSQNFPSDAHQFRLSLNHLTTTDGSGNVIQRPLTPHDPALTRTAVVFGSNSREDIARRDRQQMARDLYVMLYTLGGGLDFATQNDLNATPVGAQGYTGSNVSPNPRLYSARHLREMAQYAVNIVDALDADHIMTKFEYDKNLGDGWNLNDNAYDIDGFTPYLDTDTTNYNANYPEDSDDRGVVYGVEAQDMVLSEALVIRSNKIMTDELPTEYNDTIGHRYFTYLELRNISADVIAFDGQYRIRVLADYTPAPAPGTAVDRERRLTLLQGFMNPDTLTTIGNAGQTDAVAPPAPNHSRFQVPIGYTSGAPTFSAAYAQIVPPAATALNFELLNDTERAAGKYRITKGDDTDITTGAGEIPGGFLNETTINDDSMGALRSPADFTFKFILERRQYPSRPSPTLGTASEENDNPWVPIDLFKLNGLKQLALAMGDTGAMINTQLSGLISNKRDEPLNDAASNSTDTNPAVTGMDGMSYSNLRLNTMGLENTNTGTPFNLWQTIYDRPLASPVELLHIPVFGPHQVTRWTGETRKSPQLQTDDMEIAFADTVTYPTPGDQTEVPYAANGAGKILQPEFIRNQDGTNVPKEPAFDNRWYRLLEFFEVPTRMHRQLGNPLDLIRQPGRINLNNLRYPDVLAGLLDDADFTIAADVDKVMRFDNFETARPRLYSKDASDSDTLMPNNQRDWWVQFLKSRDGRLIPTGPLAVTKQADNVTGLFLPGLADSSPFRGLGSLGFVQSATRQSPNDALESTIFRKLPFDLNTPTADSRHLWEVGNLADHASTVMDSEMRHRLLSKIYNNTTTRSHVFLVYVSVQPFEADDTAGAQNVRIGGVLRDTNGNPQFNYRGFFVIDRSQPEDAYVFDSTSGTGTFSNYQALIKYRLRLN